ncbi:hypothetical protein [Cupriavidus sp. TMH.W2]
MFAIDTVDGMQQEPKHGAGDEEDGRYLHKREQVKGNPEHRQQDNEEQD